MKLGFFDRVSKNAQISYFMKIRPVETELFCADRSTCGGKDGLTDRHGEANCHFFAILQTRLKFVNLATM